MSGDMPARLTVIRERESKATPGPWKPHHPSGFYHVVTNDFDPKKRYPHDTPICALMERKSITGAGGIQQHDMEFIAHSRADVPFLLGVAEASWNLLEAFTEAMEQGSATVAAYAALELHRAFGAAFADQGDAAVGGKS